MIPFDLLARALAAALLDGPWDAGAMADRVRDAIDVDGPWVRTLTRALRSTYAEPPTRDIPRLAALLYAMPAFGEAIRADVRIRRYAIPAPEMAESPWRVPALATTRELATWIGLPLDALEILADRKNLSARDPRRRHYHYAWIAKPLGGQRLIEAPKLRLRTMQRRILDGILAHIPPHDAAHGFRAGRSVLGFARPHVGREVVIRVDLQAFFSSVFAARVAGILTTAGYPYAVAQTIAALCTHRTPHDILSAARGIPAIDRARLRTPHLPQGAPTSGALANLAAYRLDLRVAALARTVGATYSRYADDLVLSGDRSLARSAPSLVGRLGAIAIDEGFALNFRKTRVMTAADRQRITGIVVNDKPSVPRAEVERLRATIHNCRRFGPATQNRDDHPDFRAHLRGRIEWVRAVDPIKGARLRAAFDEIRWESQPA